MLYCSYVEVRRGVCVCVCLCDVANIVYSYCFRLIKILCMLPSCISAYIVLQTYWQRTYIHTYIHTYVHACIHIYIHIYIHTCVHTHACTLMRACMRTRAHPHTHTAYTHACVCTYIYIYIHTHTHSMVRKCFIKTVGCGISHKYTNIHNF
jgi:hypothetical protein